MLMLPMPPRWRVDVLPVWMNQQYHFQLILRPLLTMLLTHGKNAYLYSCGCWSFPDMCGVLLKGRLDWKTMESRNRKWIG